MQVHEEGAFSLPLVVLRGGDPWISLYWKHANFRVRSGRSGLEEDCILESGSFVTWRDVAGHTPRRWGQVHTHLIALSTRKEGTGVVGGVHDVVLRPQSRCSCEADRGSVISTGRLHLFPARKK